MHSKRSKVPLVAQDASLEETVLQMAYALDSLTAITEKVFQNVEGRVTKQRNRLQDLKNRIIRANDKVERLKGINKAITMYSSPKYPVPEQNLFFEAFDHCIEVTRPSIKIKYTPPPPNKMNLKEKMKFYHVKDSTEMLRKNEDLMAKPGLGPVPDNVTSISSVLLFNTSHDIYDKYEFINPLKIKKEDPWKSIEKEKLPLEPAPVSIREPLIPKIIPNYFYTPISQDVPDFNFPIDIPNLPGIATDFRYNENQMIQSQVQKPVQMSSHPVITEDKITIVEELPKLETVTCETLTPPPPPPPPPPPVLEPEPPPIENVPTASTSQSARGPPLPPPPPNPLPSLEPVSDLRANLMEAIRQAGGTKKLKSVQPEEKKTPTNKPTSLMEDLHNKLQMRRKGILGKTESLEGNILQKMSSMIPSLPVKQESEDEDEDDGEWLD